LEFTDSAFVHGMIYVFNMCYFPGLENVMSVFCYIHVFLANCEACIPKLETL